MSDANGPRRIFGHVAVPLGEYILVFSGRIGHPNSVNYKPVSPNIIWIFNLYTEQWCKHMIPESKSCPPDTAYSCAVAIKEDVFVFGGYNFSLSTWSTELWKLSKSSKGSFTWSTVITYMYNIKVPSPRCSHSGWTYSGKLWIFAGFGPSLAGYLNDYGEFLQFLNDVGYNNQLLSFNPSSKEWATLQCSGSIPLPRASHASTTIWNKVWLYGGYNSPIVFDELYELNMSSLIWTHVQTGKIKPQGRDLCSLNAITHHQLLLHGGAAGNKTPGDTWILDLSSKTWKQYISVHGYPRQHHTGSIGINSNSIIIGGCKLSVDSCDDHPTTFCIMLEPRSLQQLAMQTIYKHCNLISCECLPKKLIKLLGMASNEKNTEEI